MSEAKPPLASEFDKARDWRAYQITLLADRERDEYERIKTEGKRREEARAKERERTLSHRIQEETRRKLLAKQNLVLEWFSSEKARRNKAASEAERAVRIADENARQRDVLQSLEAADRYLQEKEKQRQSHRTANLRDQTSSQRISESLARRFNERARRHGPGQDRGRSR